MEQTGTTAQGQGLADPPENADSTSNEPRLLIDPETGEILGFKDDERAEFRANTPGAVDWVMSKIMECDSELVGIDNHPEVVRARTIVENADRMRLRVLSRRNWLTQRFMEDVRYFVSATGKRSYASVFGTIRLRKKPSRVVIKNEEAALLWATNHCPQAIRTTAKVLVSEIEDLVGRVRNATDSLTLSAFDTVPESESVAFDSGIKPEDSRKNV
jgi:hypothetical protein